MVRFFALSVGLLIAVVGITVRGVLAYRNFKSAKNRKK